MPISNYLADAQLNNLLRSTAYVPPTTGYIALFGSDPGRVYSAATELAATGGYTRVAVAKGDPRWTAPAASGLYRSVSNLIAVSFGTASAAWNGGALIAFWGYMDAATVGTGNLLWPGTIGTPKAVGAGDPVLFDIGALQLMLGGA